MGPDEGFYDVPDPIARIDIMLVSLDPTRTPMSFPFMTINGPMFIFIPLMFMPGICPMGLAEGLAPGIGIFIPGIFICGDAADRAPGEGEACGICIPGIFICICCCGEACGFGEADGICIPGMFISIFCGDAEGDGLVWGIFIPGMFCIPGFIVERASDRLRRCFMRCVPDIFIPGIFIPGMFAMLCFFAAGFFLRVVLFFCELVLLICIPGMFFISCGTAEEIRPIDKMAVMITTKREILLNSMLSPVYSHTFPALRDFSKRNCADLYLHSNHCLI